MSGYKLAEAFVAISTRAKDLIGGFAQAKGQVMAGVGGLQQALAGLGVGVSFGAIVMGAESLAAEAFRGIDAQKRLEAVITSTGGAAGFTADELGEYAHGLQKTTNVEDEAISEGIAKLLTFKSVTGDVFKRATEAAIDLAQTGFGEVTGNAVQLGKALENPTKGVAALGKAGVTFTDAEKEKIKTMQKSGDLLGAQLIVMAAVEGQVKGVAAEMAKTPAGILRGLALESGDLNESLGAALIPSLIDMKTHMLELKTFAVGVAMGFLSFNESLGGMPVRILAVTAGVIGLRAAIIALRMAGVTAFNVIRGALVASGWGIAIVALGAIGALFIDLTKNAIDFLSQFEEWDVAIAGFSMAWENLKAAASATWDAIYGMVSSVMASLGFDWMATTDSMEDGFSGFLMNVVQWFSDMVLDVSEWVRVIADNWGLVWEIMKVTAEMGLLFLRDLFYQLPEVWAWSQGRMIKAAVDAFRMIVGFIGDALSWMGNKLVEFASWAWEALKSVFTGENIEAFFSGAANLVVKKAKGMGSAFAAGLNGEGVSTVFDVSDEFKAAAERQVAMVDKLKAAKKDLEGGRQGKIDDMLKKEEKKKEPGEVRVANMQVASMSVEAGFHKFEDIGKKIQEGMIKAEGGDKDSKNVELTRKAAEEQVKLMERVADAVEDDGEVEE